MAETVTVAGAREDLVAVRVVVVGRQARAAVRRRVESGIALADTGGIVAQTMAAAGVVPA